MSEGDRLELAIERIDAGSGAGLGVRDMIAKATDGMTQDEMGAFKSAVFCDKELSDYLDGFSGAPA